MSVSETHGGRRVQLFVRSLSPSGSRRQQRAVLERLATLEEAGRISEYDVHVWGKQAPASSSETHTDAGSYALDRVSRFREWAAVNEVSMESTFELREVDAEISDDHYRTLVFPTFLLAEYRDDAIECVTPHRSEDGVATVVDRLARLDRGEAAEYEPIERAGPTGTPPSRSESRPEPIASE